jgi:hypothetical protein
MDMVAGLVAPTEVFLISKSTPKGDVGACSAEITALPFENNAQVLGFTPS